MRLGAIEAGGTKFICGIGNEHGEVIERISIQTTTPDETMGQVIDFFKNKEVDAIGVGSFGPVDLDVSSSTYGFITSTPKKYWNQFDLLGELKKHFDVPIGFDTDVNAAALGESVWGAAKGLDSCLYMTVGTGIGVGAVAEGKLIHGMLHPEMGHILVRRHEKDAYQGSCPFHGDCLEGMAAGPAIEARWGRKGVDLAANSGVWELEAYYLAQALVNYILVLSPQKIIIGGGVMKQEQLFPLVRKHTVKLLNGYIQHENILKNIDHYIVPPGLGDNAGLCGALALAKGC
ncbi:ROK family protein [Fictibacillus barbaricus]|uniref:fructokinase n=1 Tax=Fictibacillus barbaricus TaxID=182136 RepID=A0ABS2ZJ19_9BACL|nr:ROK family protein [Fictibacillus barbaricus]MBN3546641.1 ROK family protein [Fictibacillus barbaricus]GGB42619.1 fructokinase [Fictibacillus barbaricus]